MVNKKIALCYFHVVWGSSSSSSSSSTSFPYYAEEESEIWRKRVRLYAIHKEKAKRIIAVDD